MIAKFFQLEWDIAPGISKMFDSLDSELSVKTRNDGNSNEQKSGGNELRSISLPYKIVAAAGVNILEEISTIQKMLGVIAQILN